MRTIGQSLQLFLEQPGLRELGTVRTEFLVRSVSMVNTDPQEAQKARRNRYLIEDFIGTGRRTR